MIMVRGGYLLHDTLSDRYFREPEPHQVQGEWLTGESRGTAYPNRAAAQAVARRICGRYWRLRLAVFPRRVAALPRHQLVLPAFAKGRA